MLSTERRGLVKRVPRERFRWTLGGSGPGHWRVGEDSQAFTLEDGGPLTEKGAEPTPRRDW